MTTATIVAGKEEAVVEVAEEAEVTTAGVGANPEAPVALGAEMVVSEVSEVPAEGGTADAYEAAVTAAGATVIDGEDEEVIAAGVGTEASVVQR